MKPAPYLDSDPGDWFTVATRSEGIPYYLSILRSRLWLIVGLVALCVAVALLYLFRAAPVYEAQADVLVTPVSRDSESLIGLGLPRESSDPTRDVETVARLIQTRSVARRVIEQLELEVSPGKLLSKIEAKPIAQSNIVTVIAQGGTAEGAARLATAFASAAVADRTGRLHRQLDVIIPRLRRQISRLPAEESASRQALLVRLRDLESLRAGQDPTIHLESPAEPPSAPVAPRPMLSLAAAVLAGLVLGIGAALASTFLDTRLRNEDQLRRYRIPILARIPLERRLSRVQPLPLAPGGLSPATRDAYLVLGATLSAERPENRRKRSVLVTGPGSGEGKTTTSLNLAASLAASEDVVLVEGDARNPTLARALSITPQRGVVSVISGRVRLASALVKATRVAPRLKVLLQSPEDMTIAAVMTPETADGLIAQAHAAADWLIFDAAPLAYVSDPLPLVTQVDDVVLVVRPGVTRLQELAELAELLATQAIRPRGFVVVGGRNQAGYYVKRPNRHHTSMPVSQPPVTDRWQPSR